jgi:hypothetical protein
MKTRILSLIVLIGMSQLVQSQEHEIVWGTLAPAGAALDSYIPLGWVGNQYICIQMDRKTGTILTIKDNMDMVSQKVMLTGQKKFEADYIFMYDGKIQMLYSEFENGEKTNYVRANSFTLQNKPGGLKMKKVAAVKLESNSEKADFQYYHSQDSSKLLIVHVNDMGKKDDVRVAVQVVDVANKMESVWNEIVDLPYISKDFEILTGAVNNEGEVVLVGELKLEKSKGEYFHETHVINFNGAGGKFEDKALELEDKYISSLAARFLDDKQLLVAGFYVERRNNGSSAGLTGGFIEILETGRFLTGNQLVSEIDTDVKEAISPTSGLAKLLNNDELNRYAIQDLILNPDGSGYVIAEQRYMRQDLSDPKTVSRTYYFNHILMFKFDSDQQISWFSSIPKQQITTTSTLRIGFGPISFYVWPNYLTRYCYKYNSYTAVEKDGNIYLLYNDHKKNGDARTLKETSTMSNKNTALATLVTIDEEGNWTKEALFRGKDVDAILEASSCWPMPGIGFVVSAERGKNLMYGQLNL